MTQAIPLTNVERSGIALVFNPAAASNRRQARQLLPQLEALDGIRLYVTESLEDLERAADAIASETPDYLAISGGDGTISHTLTAVRQRRGELPPVALLRGGSMNMVANSVGAARDPLMAVRGLLNLEPTREVQRDTMRINGRLGFIFGLGLVTNFLEAYYAGAYTGPRRAAAVVAQVVGSTVVRGSLSRQVFRRCRGTVLMDNRVDRRDWTVILAQTIENLGIGFTPSYRAFETPGTFHVLGGDISPGRFVGHLNYVYKGRAWPVEANMLDDTGQRMRFESDEPFLYTVDGELLQAGGAVEVACIEPTRFVVPEV